MADPVQPRPPTLHCAPESGPRLTPCCSVWQGIGCSYHVLPDRRVPLAPKRACALLDASLGACSACRAAEAAGTLRRLYFYVSARAPDADAAVDDFRARIRSALVGLIELLE